MKRKIGHKPSMHDLIEIGVSQSYASELACGKKVPSLRLAQRIEEEIGYPAGFWKITAAQASAS